MSNVIFPATTINGEDFEWTERRVRTSYQGNRSAYMRHLISEDRKRAGDQLRKRIADMEAELEELRREADVYDGVRQEVEGLEAATAEIVQRKLDDIYKWYSIKRGRVEAPYLEAYVTGPGFIEDAEAVHMSRDQLQAYCELRWEREGAWVAPSPPPAPESATEGEG